MFLIFSNLSLIGLHDTWWDFEFSRFGATRHWLTVSFFQLASLELNYIPFRCLEDYQGVMKEFKLGGLPGETKKIQPRDLQLWTMGIWARVETLRKNVDNTV